MVALTWKSKALHRRFNCIGCMAQRRDHGHWFGIFALNPAVWALGLLGRPVQWRGTEFVLLPDGNLAMVENA